MKLQHIKLDALKTTSVNVRKIGAKDVADLVPSIRSLGVLQPLLVRPNCEGFEIVAGQRRYHALHVLADEGIADPVPCMVMAAGDDAKAIEASLAENVARLPMDEIDQYKAFAALVARGQSVEDIATQFGVTERLVTQQLAIANLISPILTAYRKDHIQATTVRLLTMATKAQQKAWLALFRSEAEHAPQGYQLKTWLFGGAQISTSTALFDLEGYNGNIISDLFGEDSYFDDPEAFWAVQNVAIAKAKEVYLAEGWADVVVLDVGEHFPSWDYVDTDKPEGGKVYVHIAHNGEVTFYEGQLSRKDITGRGKSGAGETASVPKPELTKAMQNYLDLHRHAAVRSELLAHQGIALRIAVAQIIAGSDLWNVVADPQKANTDAIADSLSTNQAEDDFAKTRQQIKTLLGMTPDTSDTLVYRKEDWGKSHDLHAIFGKLSQLSDDEVIQILTFVVAECLPCGSALVESLGVMMKVDMHNHWHPDQIYLDLMRDKEALNAMVGEIAGKEAAAANITATAKVQKSVIQDCLNGTRKPKMTNWHPRHMAFPMKAYTKKGGIAAIAQWNDIKRHIAHR
jgi:ParB family chromosome partitioning protein